MSNRIDFNTVSFHITNQCNLNCDGCYTLSNYDVKEHYLWSDYAESFSVWAEKINIRDYGIIGGEPILNPSHIEWIYGLAKLWPDATALFRSNGHGFSAKNRELYKAIKDNPKTQLILCLHNHDFIENSIEKIKNWLVGPIKEERWPSLADMPNSISLWKSYYNSIRAKEWPDCDSWEHFSNLPTRIQNECINVFGLSPDLFAKRINQGYKFTDSNGVVAKIEIDTYFQSGPIEYLEEEDVFKFHQDDPIKSHDVCHNKFCQTFIGDKFYKCGTVGNFKNLADQHPDKVPEFAKELIYSYLPGTHELTPDGINQMIEDFSHHIPQCSLCTSDRPWKDIHATTNRIKFYKKRPSAQ